MIRALELPAPDLTKDPLGFFAERLHLSLPQEQIDNINGDLYLLRSVIERVELAQQKLAATLQAIEAQLESVRDALRRSQHREAIQFADKITLVDLSVTQRRELMDALWSAIEVLDESSAEKLRGCELVIKLGDSFPAEEKDVIINTLIPCWQKLWSEQDLF